jgi:hypothetical protein
MTDLQKLALPSAKELLKTIELAESPALIERADNHQAALELLRNELGVKAGEQKTISTPVGDVLINESWLSHIVEKRDAERERYVKLIMLTLKEPTEVWLADYGNNDFRKRYIKLFSTGNKQLLVVISILNDSAIWNVSDTNARKVTG